MNIGSTEIHILNELHKICTDELHKICTDDSKIHRIDAIKNDNGALGCGLSHIKALEYALKNPNPNPVADDATSSTQIPRTKSGYCYIGEDRGFRSCIQVGENDKCMSGDIFPSQEICVNPNLRK